MKIPKKTEKVSEGITSLLSLGTSLAVGSTDDSLLVLDASLARTKKTKIPLGCVSLEANHEVLIANSFENVLHVFERDSLLPKITIEEKPSKLISGKLETRLFSDPSRCFYGRFGGPIKGLELLDWRALG